MTSAGIAFLVCLPIGLASWWFGPRAGLLLAAICVLLYAVNDAVNPVPEFALAIVLRGAFFLAVVAIVSAAARRVRTLEHSAEELEAIRAARKPSAGDTDWGCILAPAYLGTRRVLKYRPRRAKTGGLHYFSWLPRRPLSGFSGASYCLTTGAVASGA